MPDGGAGSACSTIFLAPLQINTRMVKTLCHKNRLSLSVLPISMMRLVVIAVLLFLGTVPAGRLNGTEQDVFRSDVLTFHGDQRVAADSLTSDSFLVTLSCKTTDPTQTQPWYSIILRGIDPVEKALLQDAQHGKWVRFDLFRAAMIAEGIRDPELIRTYEARLDVLVAKVLAAIRTGGNTDPRHLTRSLFEAMHQEILTGQYNLHCTELSKVMSTGSFNCVSATVLFNCLAEKAGLDICALEMPGHALSRVRFADGVTMNIETTAPTWFSMQTDKERQMAMRQRIAPVLAQPNPVQAQNAVASPEVPTESELQKDHREISPVQLVATIYYNIGVDLHAKKRFPEAAAANIKALYLDRDNGQAWTNLLASLNNWALELANENNRKYKAAALILDQGVSLDPTYVEFRSNQTYVFYYWISGLAKLGRFDDARKIYASAKERRLDSESFQNLMNTISVQEARIKQDRQRAVL